MTPDCIPPERLEEYHLKRIADPTELAIIEEHLVVCEHCLDYMEATERFTKLLTAGTRAGGFDVEIMADEFAPGRSKQRVTVPDLAGDQAFRSALKV